MPDNCAVDAEGRLWIATDGNNAKGTGRTDGLWALETEGDRARHVQAVLPRAGRRRAVRPMFTPDDKDPVRRGPAPRREADWRSGKPGSFEEPSTRWPDFKDDMPPRPSIVVITKEDGGVIGVGVPG